MPLSDEFGGDAWMWPFIQAGAEQRMDTASIWAGLRGHAAEQGFEFRSNSWRAVNQMRSIASSLRHGFDRFGRAADEDLFTTAMAAPDINVRPEPARLVAPEFVARFTVTYEDPEGIEHTKLMGYRDIWRPGLTVGELRSSVADVAESMFQDNGSLQGRFIGIGSIRPSTV